MSITMPKSSKRGAASRATSKRQTLTVMLVDDHPLWRDTLRKVLAGHRFATVVAESSDGQEAVERARVTEADVILMDIQLPKQNGIEATREIVAERPDARVLVLASSENRAQVIAAIQAGARGYLIKTASSEEVRDAVHRVHQGELVFPPALADLVLDELRGKQPMPDVPEHESSFRREGDFWTVEFEGTVFRLKNTRGARFLAELLRSPGKEFHALDLVVGDRKAVGLGGAVDAGPVLDAQAKAEYRKRMRELEQELAEADEWGDLERSSRLRDEIDALEEAISAAIGLGGRDRRAASTAERARVNVTLAVKATLTKIAEYSPQLFEHLSNTVRTGTYCSYSPDPRAPITWR